jgi:gas vesicle protein
MSKIFKVFLAGIAVGILVAPEKGSVIRKKIGKCIDDAKGKWNDLTGNGNENEYDASLPPERRTVDELVTSSPSITENL